MCCGTDLNRASLQDLTQRPSDFLGPSKLWDEEVFLEEGKGKVLATEVSVPTFTDTASQYLSQKHSMEYETDTL